jgi:hypothetical protein
MKAFDISQQVQIMFWKLLLKLNSTGTDSFCPDPSRISVWNPKSDGIGTAPSSNKRRERLSLSRFKVLSHPTCRKSYQGALKLYTRWR